MQITSIHAEYTHGDQICLVTNPEFTDEVLAQLHKLTPGAKLNFREYFGRLIISGDNPYLFPKHWLSDIEDLLNKAEDAVYEEKTRQKNEHNRLLDHMSQLFDLPIT